MTGAVCWPVCVIFVCYAARFLGTTLHPASHSSTSDSNQSIRSLPGMRSLGGRLCGRLLASSRIVLGVLCNKMAMSVTDRVFIEYGLQLAIRSNGLATPRAPRLRTWV